jgi:hypothetical protein
MTISLARQKRGVTWSVQKLKSQKYPLNWSVQKMRVPVHFFKQNLNKVFCGLTWCFVVLVQKFIFLQEKKLEKGVKTGDIREIAGQKI